MTNYDGRMHPSCKGRGNLIARGWVFACAVFFACLAGAATKPVPSVPICSGVSLSASYLAQISRDQGSGFRFVLVNKTGREIRLAQPVPSSSHWYARSHGRWLWRASNGAGGSLLDAGNEHGRVVVYPPSLGKADAEVLTLPPHRSKEWIEGQAENPVLAYKPGCNLCSYPGERDYEVVFAYAYLSAGRQPGLLSCGLRSDPVPMPPKF